MGKVTQWQLHRLGMEFLSTLATAHVKEQFQSNPCSLKQPSTLQWM